MRLSELSSADLGVLETALRSVARRAGMARPDVDDFVQSTYLQLLEAEQMATGAPENPGPRATSPTRAYLWKTARNALVDWLRQERGHWRASAAASRLGHIAIEYERLVACQAYSPHEALETLACRFPALPRPELEALCEQCAPHHRPRNVGGAAVVGHAGAEHADDEVNRREEAEQARRVWRSLHVTLNRWSKKDRGILVAFMRGVSVSQIARDSGLADHTARRNLKRLEERLVAEMTAGDLVAAREIEDVLRSHALDLIEGEELEQQREREREREREPEGKT